MNDLKVFLVIPAYNEEKKIEQVVSELVALHYHVVVVNDNSADKTGFLAKQSGAEVINHLLNRGQGAALETGTKYALARGADIIVHFDADGQFLSEDIERIIAPIKAGQADIVTGTRFTDIESNVPLFKKHIIMPLARLVMSRMYGARLSDPQNGFRAFNKKVAEELEIENDGAAHCTEIIVKIFKNKWRHQEVPISVKYHEFGQGIFSGKGRGSGGLKILKSLFFQKIIK
jgi:glycosyltransferase involved in cell wall biosynthesis